MVSLSERREVIGTARIPLSLGPGRPDSYEDRMYKDPGLSSVTPPSTRDQGVQAPPSPRGGPTPKENPSGTSVTGQDTEVVTPD